MEFKQLVNPRGFLKRQPPRLEGTGVVEYPWVGRGLRPRAEVSRNILFFSRITEQIRLC